MSAEREEGGEAGGSGAGARRPPERGGRDDGRSLVLAMRRGEAAAFAAFVERYQRLLLHYARRAGLRGDDADELVTTVLGDAAVGFVEPGARMPDDVALYLIGCFRNRMLNERRDGERRARRVREASVEEGDWAHGGERAALCSEDARRASRGPAAWEDEPPPAAAGLTALSRMLSESLSDDERRMLAWDSEDVPQREIAARLGITHAAVRQRLRRLRTRLRAASEQYAATLDGDSGRVVRRFLRRSLGAPRAASHPAAAREGARQRRAGPGPLADGAGQEPRGEGGRRDE